MQKLTQWVSSLNHKTLDATMEDMIVEVTIFAMDAEILDSFGAFFAKKLYVNVANCGMKHGRLVYTLGTFIIKFILSISFSSWSMIMCNYLPIASVAAIISSLEGFSLKMSRSVPGALLSSGSRLNSTIYSKYGPLFKIKKLCTS